MNPAATPGARDPRRPGAQNGDEALKGSLAVLCAAALWGTTGTAATFAPDVGPYAIGAAAMGVGGLLQAAVAWRGIRGRGRQIAQQWRLLALGAAAVAAYPLPFYASMRLAGVTVGTVVTIGSAPLLAALIEFALDGARPSRRFAAGAVAGIAGLALMGAADGAAGPAAATGVALGLVAGLAYALYAWTARGMMRRGVPSLTAMGATFGLGGLLLLPVLAETGAPFLLSRGNALVGLYMAAVPMFVGYLCFGYGLARVRASTATVLTLGEPVLAAILGVTVVGERLPAAGWAGVGLVVLCLAVIALPSGRRRPAGADQNG